MSCREMCHTEATSCAALVVGFFALGACDVGAGPSYGSPRQGASRAPGPARAGPRRSAAGPSPVQCSPEGKCQPPGAGTVKIATFAGGCFWCMESPFEKRWGVAVVVAGYTGGKKAHPTYQEVSSGTSGHLEAVEVRYDPALISYGELLDVFWRQIDPTDAGGQFADRGSQYQPAIFYHDEDQRRAAEASRAALQRSGRFNRPISTAILPARPFYPAEEYHQDYAKKNPDQYRTYRLGSGRERYLRQTWGAERQRPTEAKEANEAKEGSMHPRKPNDEELRRRLSPLQYEVTQQCSTEPPFANAYWNHKAEGIYVDVVSGEPLFSSRDKFNSGTGWPSFTKPLESGSVVEKEDRSADMERTEVRSKRGDSHLGHVFRDGPKPAGLRYCINSASLRFIPRADLEKEGYGKYRPLFDK